MVDEIKKITDEQGHFSKMISSELQKQYEHQQFGIALGSGGAKGIAHIGVLEVFEKNGITINEISGSSIGALIGAAYSAGMPIEEMKTISFRIDIKKLWSLFDLTNPMSGGLIKGDSVEEFLNRILPVKRFEDLIIPFKCVATDLQTGEPVIFDSGDLIPAVRASISLPGLFKPYKYQNRLLIDGGVVNPNPVNLLPHSNFRVAVILNEYRILRELSLQKIKLEEKIRNHLVDKFYPVIKCLPTVSISEKKLKFIKNISISIDGITRNIQQFILDDSTPSLVIRPEVENIPTLAFYEGNKSFMAGVKATESILQIVSSEYDLTL